MDGWFQKIKRLSLGKRLKKDKKILLLLAAGILGMLLLLASELFPAEEKDGGEEAADAGQVADDRQSYISQTEQKLEDIISSISGAGRTKVMVTLENSEESVWATQGSHSRENGGETDGNSYSEEEEYVLIQSSSSEEGGLLLKIIQPKIRGVAIVCDGGDNVYVREKITSTVASVLDISTAKISIAKMASEQ